MRAGTEAQTIHLKLVRGEGNQPVLQGQAWPEGSLRSFQLSPALLQAALTQDRRLRQQGGLFRPLASELVYQLGSLLGRLMLPKPLLKDLLIRLVNRERLRICWQVDELAWAGLPWECAYLDPKTLRDLRQDLDFAARCHEFLREQGGPFFLFLPHGSQRLAFFRVVAAPGTAALTRFPLSKLRVLLGVADPYRTLNPNAAAALQPSQAFGSRLEVDLLVPAERERLLQRLQTEEPYHVFVFYGHGEYHGPERSCLLLEASRGADPLSPQELAEALLARPERPLGLVVLIACESGIELAHQLALAGVPAVVAMQSRIAEAHARDFLEAFMQELSRGSPLEDCLVAGRQALLYTLSDAQVDRFEWAIPVLVTRSTQTAPFQPQDPLAHVPFVDREREFAELWCHLEPISSSQGKVIFLTGEEGVGKTRLAHELITRLRLRIPLLLLQGRGQEGQRTFSLAPLAEAIRSGLSQWTTAELAGLSPVWQAEVAEMVPQLRRYWPETVPNPALPPEQARLRRFEGLTQFFLELTNQARRLLVLWLDDLHWLDEVSLAFLDYALPRLKQHPFVFLGTYHQDLPLPAALKRLLHHRELEAVTLPLSPLPENALRDLLQQLNLTTSQVEVLAHRLHRETAGNPLFLVHVLRHGLETGWLRREGPQPSLQLSPEKARIAIPKALEETLQQRLDRLSPAAQACLNLAAVLGPSFDLRLLERLWQGPPSLPDTIEELLERHLLFERVNEGRLYYEFSHRLVQKVVYSGLSEIRRRTLHRQVTACLKDWDGEEESERQALLAWHAYRAGAFAEAVEAARVGVRRATEVYRWQAGLELATLGLEALERWHPSPEREAVAFELGCARVDLCNALGRREEQARDLKRLAMLAPRLGPRYEAIVGQKQAELAYRKGQFEQARQLATVALTHYRELEDPAGQAACLNLIGNALHDLGRYPEALDHHHRALALRQAREDLAGEAASLNNLGRVNVSLGQYQEALEHYQSAFRYHRQLGDPYAQAITLNNLGGVYTYLGNYAAARGCYQEALELCRSLGHRQGEASALNNLGTLHQNLGNYNKAAQHYRQALALRCQISDEAGIALALSNLGWISWALGDYRAAWEHHVQALRLRRRSGDRRGQATCWSNLGLLHLSWGQPQRALASHRRALNLRLQIGDRHGEGISRLQLARALSAQQGWDEALAELEQAQAIFQRLGDRRWLGYAWLVQAQVHHARGQHQRALERCRQARSAFEALHAADAALEAWTLEAQIQLELGRLDRARACSDRALERLEAGGTCPDPQGVYFTRHRLLEAMGQSDPDALRRAVEVVHRRAQALDKDELRRRFLEVPLNRAILAAWAALEGGAG